MAIVELVHLLREPRADVDAVGDVADGHLLLGSSREERRPHGARDLAVQRRHRVGAARQLQREDRHAEPFVRIGRVDASERQQLVRAHAHGGAQRAEVLVDQRRREAIVARRHRRVRREHDLRRDSAQRFGGADAFGRHALARQLERGKRAVSLVEMDDTRRDAERRQRLDPAHAKQQLLADADAIVAAVQPRCQAAILGLIAVDVGIEQQERVSADGQLPHARDERARARVDADRDRLAARVYRRLERQQRAVDVAVVLLLIARQIESLREISLVVVQPDADERNAEIGRRLDVIAGEDAEAARVDRNRFVQAELGREIRDGSRPEHARVPRAPRARRREVLLHAAVRVVDAAVQHERRRALFEQRGRYLPEQRDGIVIERAPQRRIERAEEARRVVIPAPPHVARERLQPLVRRRDELPERARLAHDRGELRSGHRQHADRIGAERARLDRLDDEHALQQSLVDERHAEKRVIRIFASLAEIFEARMGGRVFHDQRRQLFRRPGRPALPTIACARARRCRGADPTVAASTSVERSGSSR